MIGDIVARAPPFAAHLLLLRLLLLLIVSTMPLLLCVFAHCLVVVFVVSVVAGYGLVAASAAVALQHIEGMRKNIFA